MSKKADRGDGRGSRPDQLARYRRLSVLVAGVSRLGGRYGTGKEPSGHTSRTCGVIAQVSRGQCQRQTERKNIDTTQAGAQTHQGAIRIDLGRQACGAH
jgi:hypothetical protein